MNKLQIVLICILALLGFAFIAVLFMRSTESKYLKNSFAKKKLGKVVEILKESPDNLCWAQIRSLFHKNGKPDYTRIVTILTHIVDNECDTNIKNRAASLLQEKETLVVFGDNEITYAIEEFDKAINQGDIHIIKKTGSALKKQVRQHFYEMSSNNKYDHYIQWILNLMNVFSFVLALVSICKGDK